MIVTVFLALLVKGVQIPDAFNLSLDADLRSDITRTVVTPTLKQGDRCALIIDRAISFLCYVAKAFKRTLH